MSNGHMYLRPAHVRLLAQVKSFLQDLDKSDLDSDIGVRALLSVDLVSCADALLPVCNARQYRSSPCPS
jgi:hypothetical protein